MELERERKKWRAESKTRKRNEEMKSRRKIAEEKETINIIKYDLKMLMNIVVLWSSAEGYSTQQRLSAFVIKVS